MIGIHITHLMSRKINGRLYIKLFTNDGFYREKSKCVVNCERGVVFEVQCQALCCTFFFSLYNKR